MQSAKISLMCMFPVLLKLPPSNLEWSASLVSPCPLRTGPILWTNNWWASQETEEMGLEKEASLELQAEHLPLCGEGGLYVWCLWTTTGEQGCPKNSGYFNIFVRGFSEITVNFTYLFETAEELIVSLSPRGKHVYCEFTVECAALATRLRKPQCWYLYVFPLGWLR